MYQIYIATNLVNNKVYVGQTRRSLEQRWKGHLKHVRHGRTTHLANSIRKHGADVFHLQEVAFADTKDKIDNLEKLWITILCAADPQLGYNGTFGGDGGWSNESTKMKQRLAHLGKKHSEETRLKMSSIHKILANSKEGRERRSRSNAERYKSEDAHRKMSEAITLWWKKRKEKLKEENGSYSN